jgi:hypothetical protein
MRNTIIGLLLVAITACTGKEYTDKRPAEQVRLMNIISKYRDTVNAAAANGAMRSSLLENGVMVIKDYISDSLELKFTGWEARVLSVAADPSEPGYIIASFGMNLNGGAPTERTRYESVVFTSRSTTGDPADAVIKSLETGDIISIDGTFNTLQKTIDIDSYNDLSRSKNVLDNPEFRVTISKAIKL